MSRSRLLPAASLLCLLAVLALTGCSHGGSSGGSMTDAGTVGGNGGPVTGGNGSAAGGKSNGTAATPAPDRTALQQRQVVRTATVQLVVPDVDRAAQSAITATAGAGGRVDTDDRSTGDAGRHAHLVLRVPAAGLDRLLNRVVALGHETDRTEQATDSTAEVADVNARVTELQISVGRLQDFLRRSGSIADLLALESQLTQRQSDLQSTVAQQRALADQVELATLTVELDPPAALSRSAANPPGFLGAIRASLHALLLSCRVALALLGYLAPFLLIAAAVGYPALRLRRSRRPRPDVAPDAGAAQ